MRSNQRVLELHPFISKLLDSLCLELAVNVPDANSLTLIDILTWKRNNEITQDEFKQLYKSWLEAKNVFDLFSAKQITAYSKVELISQRELEPQLSITHITKSLEYLNNAYNELYLARKNSGELELRALQEVEGLFSYMDWEGTIHLRLSELFFLAGALLICGNYTIPSNYEAFRVHFREINRDMCEIDGIVSLRWFKNYIMHHPQRTTLLKHLRLILQEFNKVASLLSPAGKKGVEPQGLPRVIDEAFTRWRGYARFAQQKKKMEVYRRVFEQNESVFFFSDEQPASEEYFVRKYGEEFVKCLEIDNLLLKQFSDIVRQLLGEYIIVFGKVSTFFHKAKHAVSLSATQPRKKMVSELHPKLESRTSIKERTPKKSMRHEEERRNITPTHRNVKTSPFLKSGSTEKIQSSWNGNRTTQSKQNREHTPTKGNYPNYGMSTQQIYKAANKVGLEKDSFYEKMFFFRNKRVESYDIVIKRLKGK